MNPIYIPAMNELHNYIINNDWIYFTDVNSIMTDPYKAYAVGYCLSNHLIKKQGDKLILY